MENLTKLLTVLIILLPLIGYTQPQQTPYDEALTFQHELNKEFKDKEKSPLEKKDRRKFRKLPFFEINPDYRVTATLETTSNSLFFAMKTTTERLPQYRIYGMLNFKVKGKQFSVPVYQSMDLMKKLEYKDYLFFPFTDLTNGSSTYGGGRYIELSIPKEGNTITIDFNKAYNPYCAYSGRYSCPIVPEENHLDVGILAGVKYDSSMYKH